MEKNTDETFKFSTNCRQTHTNQRLHVNADEECPIEIFTFALSRQNFTSS